MDILQGKLKIELMSDLCVGSGYSYAGVIDSDVAYDEYGIPYIPAKRLKGCMREAAEQLCPELVEKLFGQTGDDGTKGMILENAYIEDYDLVRKELGSMQNRKCREAVYLSPQNILKMYTDIRAQTKLCRETGVAEKNTLRYTRVVGQYDPRQVKVPLCFYAKMEFEEAYQDQMERVVKAVRNMGMGRNRGLGSIRCSLTALEHRGQEKGAVVDKREGKVCLTYVLRNCEPLLMSSDNNEVSDSYISGKSILGTLAGVYLRREGAMAESEEFRKLFLDGSTLFTDANITVPPEKDSEFAAQWPDYYPAPLYLNRLKITKALINLLGENRKLPEGKEADYSLGNGNLPKRLKTHYVHEAGPNVFDVLEPEREILYHNSHRKDLYSQEAIKEGQYFRGQIYTDKKYANMLKDLLEQNRISLGKSKTAQYGACELATKVAIEDIVEDVAEDTLKKTVNNTVSAGGGERIAVVLRSDSIFINEAAGYTVRFDEVKELIGEQLGIPYEKATDQGSILQTKEITGYNTKWNLRRPGIPAVKSGSVLVYTISAGESWKGNGQAFVGERNLEGYGQVRIINCREMSYVAFCPKESEKAVEKEKDMNVDEAILQECKPFLVRILTEQLLEHLVFQYTRERWRLNLTASTVGRLNLMLHESLNEYRTDPEQALKNFCCRVGCIKRKKEKEEAFRFLGMVLLKEGYQDRNYGLDYGKMVKDSRAPELKEIRELLEQYCTEAEYREVLTGLWGLYMEEILTWHKYQKKHE